MTSKKSEGGSPRTKPRGQVIWSKDHWKVRVRYADGTRPFIHLPVGMTKDAAIARAKRLAVKAKTEGWTLECSADDNTAKQWFEVWLDTKDDRGQTGVEASRSHFRTWIAPAFEGKRMTEITVDDLDKLVETLDTAVVTKKLKWKSAINIWGTVTKAFDDACRGKQRHLRVRPDNPTKLVRGPDRGPITQKVHLYPDEFLTLVSCPEVPLVRRRYYAVATYCYLRPGELEVLRWEDVDLARKTVFVQRGIDRNTLDEKDPKAGVARTPVPMEPNLFPLLEAMSKAASGGERVFETLGDDRALARTLRDDLLVAKCDRRELHHKTRTRDWMTMHDCRTTGITWMAVRGDEPFVVMARAGHHDLKMTMHYIHFGAVVRRDYGEVFPALPEALLG